MTTPQIPCHYDEKITEEALAARYWYGARLTKKLLFSLPAGKFIMSNCLTSPQDSVFSAQLKEDSDRELLWKLAKNQGANGRNLHVFDSREDCVAWLDHRHSGEGPDDQGEVA